MKFKVGDRVRCTRNVSIFDTVVGIIETKRYMAGRFSNTKYENMKKVIYTIKEEDIKKRQQG